MLSNTEQKFLDAAGAAGIFAFSSPDARSFPVRGRRPGILSSRHKKNNLPNSRFGLYGLLSADSTALRSTALREVRG